jgi:hypothetical protein
MKQTFYADDVMEELEKLGFFEVNEWDLIEANPELREEKMEDLNQELEWEQRELDWLVKDMVHEKEMLDIMTRWGDTLESGKQRRKLRGVEKKVKQQKRLRDVILRKIARLVNLPREIDEFDCIPAGSIIPEINPEIEN